MMIESFLSEDCVIANLTSTTRDAVLAELAYPLARVVSGVNAVDIQHVLLEREEMGSTGIGEGFAIPHAKIPGLERIVSVVGRSVNGIAFDSHDGDLVHFFFVLLSPESAPGPHLLALARLSKLFKDENLKPLLANAKTAHEIYDVIVSEDRRLQ